MYIISGCNGAGKTTASFTILPDLLSCNQFVNADEIARGLSPFNPETVRIQAGRIMLNRMEELISQNQAFAFETTLSTKSYVSKIKNAQSKGYKVKLLFFFLSSPELAEKRVKLRVKEGGHDIPKLDIKRRYYRGIINLFERYFDLVDETFIFDNSNGKSVLIAEKCKDSPIEIINSSIFALIQKAYEKGCSSK